MVLATPFPRCTTRVSSQVCHVSPLESWSQAVTLLADVNHPGSQEDVVSNWKPTHSLVKDAFSGAEIAPCLLVLAVTHLPLCLQQGHGPVCNRLTLLWYSLNPLFCEWARLCLRWKLFRGKFSLSLSLFSLWLPPQFGLLSHVSSFRLSSGHSGLVLTLSMQCMPPCTAPIRWWQTRASRLLLHWELWLGAYYVGFFPSSYVALWDSQTPHRPASERVPCCLETSPSCLPPQDRSSSLTLLSLFLCFIFCPTSFWREWAAFLGAWGPPPAFRSCFLEVAQHSNDLFLWERSNDHICGGKSGLSVLFLCHLRTT